MILQFVTETPEGEHLQRLFPAMIPKSSSFDDTMKTIKERITERIEQRSTMFEDMNNMDFVCLLEEEDRVYNCTVFGKPHIEGKKDKTIKKEKSECFYTTISTLDNAYKPNFEYDMKAHSKVDDSIFSFLQSSRRATLIKKYNISLDRNAKIMALAKIDKEIGYITGQGINAGHLVSIIMSDTTIGLFAINEQYYDRFVEMVMHDKLLEDWEKCIVLPTESEDFRSKLSKKRSELTSLMDKALDTKDFESCTAIQRKLLTLKEFILD